MAGQLSEPREWSGPDVQRIIDRELGRNPELRSGYAAYAAMLQHFQYTGDGKRLRAGILDNAARQYRRNGVPRAELFTFNDGGADFLFDLLFQRTVLVWGSARPWRRVVGTMHITRAIRGLGKGWIRVTPGRTHREAVRADQTIFARLGD